MKKILMNKKLTLVLAITSLVLYVTAFFLNVWQRGQADPEEE